MKSALIIFNGLIALGYLSGQSNAQECGANEEMGWVTGCEREKICNEDLGPQGCWPMPAMPACVCKQGFIRGYLGDCISDDECAQCSKPNEFFGCSSACDNECKTIQTQSRLKCPIQNIVCNRRCYCKDGYARDPTGNCILVEQCGS